jgi:hypothetical protein
MLQRTVDIKLSLGNSCPHVTFGKPGLRIAKGTGLLGKYLVEKNQLLDNFYELQPSEFRSPTLPLANLV